MEVAAIAVLAGLLAGFVAGTVTKPVPVKTVTEYTVGTPVRDAKGRFLPKQ